MTNFAISCMTLLGLHAILSVQNVYAVQCYACNTFLTEDCKDPFSGVGVRKDECETGCVKMKGKNSKGYEGITRSCSDRTDNKCKSGEDLGFEGEGCACQTDLCNSAERPFRFWTMAAGVASICAVLRVF
ncbi:hypothetical protein MAR_008920 [Mya arenaria]|uniref:Protein quiver n=1 Tax=Mya arenaria TaxID=6604 RepID=A0ABY7DX91_MYAAR|nr:protein quiver-like [Mya arenaria]XP_052801938.1 protein quiver-like [Mya arenaria]WAR02362.1 hypothetical protein MAR_008920 [Mya arenaria]